MDRRTFIGSVASSVLAAPLSAFAQAQQSKVYHVGVIHEGGPYNAAVDGLKDGLKELGLAEGKHYVLEVRDLKGDRRAAEAAARSLEREKVDLIYTVATSVTTVVKRATTEVPIVFAVGSDPVAAGLVESFAKPGGRCTGVHFQSDLTAKRLEILKAIVPRLHRVVTFYDPSNASAMATSTRARPGMTNSRAMATKRGIHQALVGRYSSQGVSRRVVSAIATVATIAIRVIIRASAEANCASRFSSTSCQTSIPVVQACLPPSMRADT